jgi:integrase
MVRKRPRLYTLKPEIILEIGRSIVDPIARGLYFFLYLTGARINEASDFQINRVEVLEDRINIRLLTLKQRTKNKYRNVIVPHGAITKCFENEMWAECWQYLKHFKNFDKPFSKWPKDMDVYLRRNVSINVEGTNPGGHDEMYNERPLNPHYLRICRATHLADHYFFTDNQLCKFFGWKNPEMAERYTEKSDVWPAFSKHNAH